MQVREGGIKRLVMLSSTIVIITITIAISLFLITTENKNFQVEVQRIEDELITSRKLNIQNRLENIINEIKFDQILMRKLQLEELKNFIEILRVSLHNASGFSNKIELKKLLSRYDKDDSIHAFAFYQDGTILWNPRNSRTEGKNYLNAQDINDQFYIKSMIENAISNQKENAISFTWYIPDETKMSTNISYVTYLPKLNLIVGAYRSEDSISRWVQMTVLEKLSTHQYGKDSFFFVDYLQSYTMKDDFSKTLLQLGNEEYIKVLKENKTKKMLSQIFLEEGFDESHNFSVEYKKEQYLFHTMILPKWRWIVGLGENLQELTKLKDAQLKRARTNRDVKIVQLSVLTLVIALIFFILSRYLASAIENLLLNYRQRADAESDKYQALYQHSNDSFLLAKEEGLKIVDANPKALNLTSMDKSALLNSSLHDYFKNLDFKKIKNEDSGYERTSFTNILGEVKTVEFTFVWIQLQSEKMIFVSLRDITERMKLVSERRQQEQLLIQQSKMASMGEMLGNIAHQWRQPLSQLSALFMDLESAYTFGELNKEYIRKNVDEANDTIEYMSRTIDDFRNFFNPHKTKESFLASKALEKAIKIIHSSFESHEISLHVNIKSESQIYGYENEYAQVILNILSNAKDILIERKVQNPKVAIEVYENNKRVYLSIHDNAGGIDESVIKKVFEPYFTTKYDYGTGIGLYMSKVIIEKNMNGQILVENTSNGAKFTICL